MRLGLWLCLLLCPLGTSAVEIKEWTVPWPESRPRDPDRAADGRVWFVGQRDNYLAVFDPASEAFTRYDLPAGTAPHTVSLDAQGRPWVAGNGNGTVLRFGSDGVLQQTYSVPEDAGLSVRDPHTFAFDGRGGVWFTLQRGNAVGHLDIDSGRMRVIPVPTAQARPYGIVATPEGDAWVALFGVGKLAKVDHADFSLKEVVLPRELARPRRIARAEDGALWYVDYAQDYLGRLQPDSGTVQEWRLPMQPAAPYALARSGDGWLWLVTTATQPNRMLGFDPAANEFVISEAIPSGGGAVRHMHWYADCQCLWFGSDRNTLGRARLEARD